MPAISLHPQDQRVVPIDGTRFMVLTEVNNPAANASGGGYTVVVPISATTGTVINSEGATAPDFGSLGSASASARSKTVTFGNSTAGTPGKVMIITLHNSATV